MTRITETDLESQAESRTSDLWYRQDEIDAEGVLPRDFSSPWRGQTMFHLLRPAPCPGYRWAQGRLTHIQKTQRPDNVTPEAWLLLSHKQKQIAIDKWKVESKILSEARKLRQIDIILSNERHSSTLPKDSKLFSWGSG